MEITVERVEPEQLLSYRLASYAIEPASTIRQNRRPWSSSARPVAGGTDSPWWSGFRWHPATAPR